MPFVLRMLGFTNDTQLCPRFHDRPLVTLLEVLDTGCSHQGQPVIKRPQDPAYGTARGNSILEVPPATQETRDCHPYVAVVFYRRKLICLTVFGNNFCRMTVNTALNFELPVRVVLQFFFFFAFSTISGFQNAKAFVIRNTFF